MEIRHLKLIKEIADKGSLTKATNSLFLSQSALSHQLKEVESQLGAPLFHRVNKKLLITGAGKIVLESAERILKDLEETTISVKRFINGDRGSVRVATECYTCYHWLPGMMVDFNREFPNVDIEISPEINANPVDALLDGSLDLGIISTKVEDPNIQSTELFADEMVAVVSADHPWARKKYVNAKDFANEHLIIHSHPLSTSTVYMEELLPAQIEPRKVTAMQITEARIEMIKAGIGVSVIPLWILKPYLSDKGITTVPITRKGLFITWYAIILNRPDSPQYLENFTKHLGHNVVEVCMA